MGGILSTEMLIFKLNLVVNVENLSKITKTKKGVETHHPISPSKSSGNIGLYIHKK
jgi:hypothetical protein